MGQMNCGACESSLVDLRSEMDLKASIVKSFSQELARPSARTTASLDLSLTYSSHLGCILAIQAFWRGRQERKAINHLLRTHDRPNAYFSRTYALETLRTGQPLVKATEARPAYRYCNGATYTGEWRGGFRHGSGVMLWSDGALFQGNWSYGYPVGCGSFALPSGERFEGSWKFAMSCMRMSLLLDSPRNATDGYGIR